MVLLDDAHAVDAAASLFAFADLGVQSQQRQLGALRLLRFARRVDAEMFAAEDEDAWRIVEHGFDETQPAGAAEQDRGIEDLLGALHRAEIEELLLPIQPPPTKERTECAGECGRSIPRGTEEGYGWPLIPMTRRYHCGSWECEQRVREQEK